MALVIKDRVKEGTTTTGTGALSLAGAAATFATFQSHMTNGDTTYYAVVHTSSGVDEWEVGIGTWNTGNTISRTTVIDGSNGTSAVNFSSGTKNVFMVTPADKTVLKDASGNLISVNLSNFDTDDLAEGSNLYFTTARIDAHLSGGTGVTYSSGAISIGQPVGTSDNVTFNNITSTGTVTLSADPTASLGAATKQYVDTIASAGIHYHDPVRVESPVNLNASYNNGSSGVGATLTNAGTQAALVIDGITLSLNDRVLIYQQTDQTQNGVYTVTDVGSASTNWVLTRSTDTDTAGPSDPNSFGKGDAFFVKEGNTGAGELYVMNTSGTITFGTTNIVFTQVAETAVYSAGDSLTLTGTVFDTVQDIRTTASPTFAGVTAPLTGNVTGNVTGDVTGNVTGDVTGDVTGNADTATTLATARTIQLTGDVTGSTTFDGSGNVSITAAVVDDSHSHIISNVDGLQTALNAKADDSTTFTAGNYLTGGGTLGANRTFDVDATSGNTASKVVARDASGDFSAGTITASLNGNATTATSAAALTTARTISLTGDVSGSTSFDGSGNVSITATVADDSHNHVTSNIDGLAEYISDTVGAMVTGNTESGISVTYDDTDNTLDFNVNDPTISLTGAVTGSATMNNLGNVSIATTATSDPTITLTGAVTGSGTMTNLGNVSISTTATADPTLTLSGDVTGSATFTNLGNATLTATVANDSHTHDGRYYTETEADARFATAAQGTKADNALPKAGGTMTGAITFASGQTFDGRDVSADGSKLDGIASGAQVNVPTNLGSGTAASSVTISSSTGSNTSISAATTSAAGVMSSADKTKLDGIESGATADQTASEILTAIKTVDGSGSGLDADTLDGVQASSFARKDTATRQDFTGSIRVSTNNSSGGGIVLADDGDIVDLNDGYASMRFSNGVRVYSANGSGSVRHTLASNGDFTATGNVTAYSDARLKDNIEKIDNALVKVNALRGVTYNRNDLDDTPRHTGVIAQEVEEVLPEVVATDDEGIKHVAYGNMVGLLIEAIKEQQQQIDELKAKLGDK